MFFLPQRFIEMCFFISLYRKLLLQCIEGTCLFLRPFDKTCFFFTALTETYFFLHRFIVFHLALLRVFSERFTETCFFSIRTRTGCSPTGIFNKQRYILNRFQHGFLRRAKTTFTLQCSNILFFLSQGYALCVMDYDFLILDNAFLVHKPGIKIYKKDARRSMLAAKTNQLIKKIIFPELKVLYGTRKGCAV